MEPISTDQEDFSKDYFEKNRLTVDDLVINSLVNEWHHPRTSLAKKQELELKFQDFIRNADIVCREDFYPFTHLLHVPTHVFFYPTSPSYTYFGPSLLIDIIYHNEIAEIKQNYNSQPAVRTAGYMRAECVSFVHLARLDASQQNRLEIIGFHTKDVYRIING